MYSLNQNYNKLLKNTRELSRDSYVSTQCQYVGMSNVCVLADANLESIQQTPGLTIQEQISLIEDELRILTMDYDKNVETCKQLSDTISVIRSNEDKYKKVT